MFDLTLCLQMAAPKQIRSKTYKKLFLRWSTLLLSGDDNPEPNSSDYENGKITI